MSEKTIKEMAQSAAYRKLLEWMVKDPDKNLNKVFDALLKYDMHKDITNMVQLTKDAWNDPDNVYSQLIHSFWTDMDNDELVKIFNGAVINGSLIGYAKQKQISAEKDCNVPWAILMDPTSACNLHCTGCWAADYGHKMNMSLETLDSIIKQGKELGCYVYIYSGGEPLVRKKDIIKLCEMHQDCAFLAFTNSTLIDEEFADEMLRVGNFVPAISVEGFEEATDSRRGEGTFKKIMKAMEILKRKKLLFGASCCYTSANYQDIGSDEFMDALMSWGAKFAWFFTYMPVGNDAVPELMVSADQRKFMYDAVRRWRTTKPIFTLDFWNDGEYVEGCIAGGKHYLHINANGDYEPCAFIHYSDSNVANKTLLEALQSPLFMGYHRAQPFNDNMLRPCPALDNPDKIAKIVDESGAISTDMTSPEDVHDLAAKCYTKAPVWAEESAPLWEASKVRRPEFNTKFKKSPEIDTQDEMEIIEERVKEYEKA